RQPACRRRPLRNESRQGAAEGRARRAIGFETCGSLLVFVARLDCPIFEVANPTRVAADRSGPRRQYTKTAAALVLDDARRGEACRAEHLGQAILRSTRMRCEAERNSALRLHDAVDLPQPCYRIGPDLQRIDRQGLVEAAVFEGHALHRFLTQLDEPILDR